MERYGDINYLMNMSGEDGIEMIVQAFEGNKRDESYQMYLTQVPAMVMSDSEFISFENYYKGNITRQKPTEKVDKEDAYSSAENILNNFKIKGSR